MAISLSPPAVRAFHSELSCTFASSSPSCSFKLQFQSPAKFRFGSNTIFPPTRLRFFPPIEAKKQTFSNLDDLLLNADKPVLVDFYATWCGPCQFMVPILNEVSTRMKDTIQVVKIDTEKYPTFADKYQIAALPTFILFKDGEPYDRFEGAMNADQLIERIENSLKIKQ